MMILAGFPAKLAAGELQARRDQMAAQLAEWEAGPRKEELEEARHNWDALAAQLAQARSDAERAEQLFKENTISPAEHDRAVFHLIADVWMANLVAWVTRRASAADVANRLELSVHLLLDK